MTKYQGYETDFQKTLARFLDQYGVVWCHVANERQTSIKQSRGGRYYSPEGNKLKSMGVKKGVPDVMIFEHWEDEDTLDVIDGYANTVPINGFGIAIELKVQKRKPSGEQKLWLAALKERGWLTAVCYSLDEVREVVSVLRGAF